MDSDHATAPNERWTLPLVLIALTFVSTTYVGAFMPEGASSFALPILGIAWPSHFAAGLAFSLPLMAILLAHEFGHYIAGRLHRAPLSPPYFIPMPFFLLGTMGAVIRMSGRIRTRNALFDVGAAGPLAGLAVAVPVLAYGLWISPVEAVTPGAAVLMEGRSLLYLGLLFLTKGPIPPDHDVFLSPTAFAGWAGLLVTMINLLPVGQLDGGHVAYAYFGPRQDRYSSRFRRALPLLTAVVGAAYGARAWLEGADSSRVLSEFAAGIHWLFWAGLLWLMTRLSGAAHPPTDDDRLSPGRRVLARVTLALFILLFMPSWIREG
ncbi:MAG: site-2 protease family protein [Myxococcales bacterium]|nr:site-2 protease family protein [Myxococcales bacterium]